MADRREASAMHVRSRQLIKICDCDPRHTGAAHGVLFRIRQRATAAAGTKQMRQTTMDRWIEAAEARRVSQIAQERWVQPPQLAPLPDSLLTRLRSMVINPDLTSGSGARRVTRSEA